MTTHWWDVEALEEAKEKLTAIMRMHLGDERLHEVHALEEQEQLLLAARMKDATTVWMINEIEETDLAIACLESKLDQTRADIRGCDYATKQDHDTPDTTYMEQKAMRCACDDCMHQFDNLLQNGKIELRAWYKNIRELSVRKFMCMELMRKIKFLHQS